jgi:uncharacterized membrane protein
MTDHTDDTDGDLPADEAGAELFSAERLVFFSDAVVAIAITLLALSLPIPNVPNYASGHLIWHALNSRGHFYDYLAFLISFVVIAGHWRSHHKLFRSVTRLDTRIITLNLGWLLTIILTPFATRVLSDIGPYSFSFYALVQVGTTLTFLFMVRHIRRYRLLSAEAQRRGLDHDDLQLLGVAAIFAISMPLSFVIGNWAFACWALASQSARLFSRQVQRRRPASG